MKWEFEMDVSGKWNRCCVYSELRGKSASDIVLPI